jgi:hypothetical protein
MFLVAACEHAGPTAPSTKLDGTWSGAIDDAARGSGTIALTVSQVQVGIAGRWAARFVSPPLEREGTLSGVANASAVSLFLTPSDPLTCPSGVVLSGTLSLTATVSGDHMVGTYTVLTCGGAASGTMDATRQ